MDLHRLAAGLVVVGFEGTEVPAQVRSLVAQGVSGAILFQRNIEGAAQVARLNDALKREAERPFVTCVDQEGGRVARLRGEPFTALPPMRALGAQGDESLAFGAGALLAREVRAVGFDVDFAPVLDVDTNPKNPVIGDRSLSRARARRSPGSGSRSPAGSSPRASPPAASTSPATATRARTAT